MLENIYNKAIMDKIPIMQSDGLEYLLKIIKENNYIEEMFNNLGKPENLKPYFEIINRVINQKIEKED